uniref:voltage-gated purine nucleotide uniporter SLC17A9 n=1 Tax=Panthera onca TaxID=9690 RepID=UPI002952A084|nr:voltage-gated purine nucleotide uniporter SLC17A9 [Panthera onca]
MQPLPPEEARRDGAEDAQWSRWGQGVGGGAAAWGRGEATFSPPMGWPAAPLVWCSHPGQGPFPPPCSTRSRDAPCAAARQSPALGSADGLCVVMTEDGPSGDRDTGRRGAALVDVELGQGGGGQGQGGPPAREPSLWAGGDLPGIRAHGRPPACATSRGWPGACPPRPPSSLQGWVFNVVPWLVAIPAGLFSGFLSDHLINQGYRTITVRKFMQVMGLGLSSVFALCLGHTSSFCKSVVFASASIGLQTFNHSGISVNIQDLAPSCAGFLFGVANTAGALAGVVGVCLGGYLIETTGSWTSMFSLVAAVSSLGLCIFLLFGEAQRVDLSPTHEDL